MTQTDTLKCVHEPFGDAFYYGPERLSERYETDEDTRIASGLSEATYKSVLNGIESQKEEVRFLLISPERISNLSFGLAHSSSR